MKQMLTALRMLVLLSLLTGVLYPGLLLATGKVFFPEQAGGSLIRHNGTVIGSALLAQKFAQERYFWPRPSAADYATLPAEASNLGPTSAALRARVAERLAAAHGEAGRGGREMLFTSGSGLDPDISPESARAQIPRVLKARGMDAVPGGADTLDVLVKRFTEPRTLGVLGEERVNVLRLNLALDGLSRE